MKPGRKDSIRHRGFLIGASLGVALAISFCIFFFVSLSELGLGARMFLTVFGGLVTGFIFLFGGAFLGETAIGETWIALAEEKWPRYVKAPLWIAALAAVSAVLFFLGWKCRELSWTFNPAWLLIALSFAALVPLFTVVAYWLFGDREEEGDRDHHVEPPAHGV